MDYFTTPHSSEHYQVMIQHPEYAFFDAKGQASKKMLELLRVVGMDTSLESNCTLEKINDWAQQNLLRKGERWETQTARFEALKPELMPLFKDLRMIDASFPQTHIYEGALVHGAILSTVRARVGYLVKQWENGIRFKTLYFLSGERDLQPELEGADALSSDASSSLKIRKDWQGIQTPVKTESEMMKLVWEQSEIPQSMRESLEICFINAPKKQLSGSDNWVRPTTEDTVLFWLKEMPSPGRYLGVSNGPHTIRQHVMTQSLAGNRYAIDTIGTATREGAKMAIILDELARLIFQLRQIELQPLPNRDS